MAKRVGSMTFTQWMGRVDQKIGEQLGGMTHEDIPDCCYRDWYEDNMTPAQAAKQAVKEQSDE